MWILYVYCALAWILMLTNLIVKMIIDINHKDFDITDATIAAGLTAFAPITLPAIVLALIHPD
jgi:hypothetical protein